MKSDIIKINDEEEMHVVKRKLEELNLLDDFLFGTMVSYPIIGEEFVREILKIIFRKDFGKLLSCEN